MSIISTNRKEKTMLAQEYQQKEGMVQLAVAALLDRGTSYVHGVQLVRGDDGAWFIQILGVGGVDETQIRNLEDWRKFRAEVDQMVFREVRQGA
jgi:hypothetical protein